jgi:hypothetical protein
MSISDEAYSRRGLKIYFKHDYQNMITEILLYISE